MLLFPAMKPIGHTAPKEGGSNAPKSALAAATPTAAPREPMDAATLATALPASYKGGVAARQTAKFAVLELPGAALSAPAPAPVRF